MSGNSKEILLLQKMNCEGISSQNREVLLSDNAHPKDETLPIRCPIRGRRLMGFAQHKAQWSGKQKVWTAPVTEKTRMGGKGKTPKSNSWVTDPKGSCSILSRIRGKTFTFQQLFTTKPPKACTSSALSPPSTVGFFSPPPHESL